MNIQSGTRSFVGPDSRVSRALLREFWELTKPRLSFLSVITALVGYLVALPERNWGLLGALMLGTSLAAGGAGALNQWWEREQDAKMVRTRNRPIPSGIVPPKVAFIYGMTLSILGCFILHWGTNSLATWLTVLTLISYVLVYTPLKLLSSWCTEIGTIPGALPPLIGWAAAAGNLSTLGWILFAILVTWQMPHFMAIAWMYRKDYAKAQFPMLSVKDLTGKNVAMHALVYTLLLVACSILPTFLGFTTWLYGAMAIISGVYFTKLAWTFYTANQRELPARRLFIASVIYLPILLAALVVDRCFIA